MLLPAAAYQRLARQAEATATLSQSLACARYHSRQRGAADDGASPVFLAASARLIAAMVDAGLPEQ